jgi:thiamine-phosphate diphosphorylase
VRGLYGIADAAASSGDPLRLGMQMLQGGCRFLQLRCKGWPADDVVVVGRALAASCAVHGARLLANDDPGVALAMGADGVHLGQTDGALAAARRILPTGILGRSTNTPAELAAAIAEGADYVAFGPVFSTPTLSRPKAVRGLAGLSATRAGTRLPLVAIGGITPENLESVRTAGADAWAVIGAIADAADPVAATRALLG